jgi:hypothetical protein
MAHRLLKTVSPTVITIPAVNRFSFPLSFPILTDIQNP